VTQPEKKLKTFSFLLQQWMDMEVPSDDGIARASTVSSDFPRPRPHHSGKKGLKRWPFGLQL
jgi:hypothetical protein